MGSEYAVIYLNMSNCARILNIPESAEIYPNMGSRNIPKYGQICLNMSNVVNMAECA